jgi:hypothetical protein
MVLFPITTLITGGNWGNVNQPITKEFKPYSDPEDRGNDWNFDYYLEFKRILIIQEDEKVREDQGFARKHENPQSQEIYGITLKSGSYSDSNNIFDQLRDILVEQPTSGTYSHFEFGRLIPAPQRGKYIYEFQILAFRIGKVRNVPSS